MQGQILTAAKYVAVGIAAGWVTMEAAGSDLFAKSTNDTWKTWGPRAIPGLVFYGAHKAGLI
jgi:hypothetical protein